MAKVRSHLDAAPVTEALIDLQVQLSSGGDLELVQQFAESIDGYQSVGPIVRLQTTWDLSKEDGAKEKSESSELGVRLQSDDEKYVLQVRTNGLTLSRLEPYETWEIMLAETKRLWAGYCRAVGPNLITRVATRFINKLKLPLTPEQEFRDFLTSPPDLPEELPQAISGFTQRTLIPHPVLGANANLIVSLQEGVVPGDYVPIILDIDVYKMVKFAPGSDECWNLLEKLRVYKNEVFFASLTEKAVELFE